MPDKSFEYDHLPGVDAAFAAPLLQVLCEIFKYRG